MEEWVRSRGKGFWSVVSLLLVLVIAVTFVFTYYLPVKVEKRQKNFYATSVSGYEGDEMFIGENAKNAKFRSNAKFRILEIVPYHGMAEIGYGIKGEEPIDIRYVSMNDWDYKLSQITGAADTKNYSSNDVLGWNQSVGYLVNNSRFVLDTLRYALELTEDEAEAYVEEQSVDVLVVEADTINNNPKLIDAADFIYVHNNFYAGNSEQGKRLLELYHDYSKEAREDTVKYDGNGQPKFGYGGVTDLSAEVISKIYDYAFVKKMPVTFSGYSTRNEASEESNYQNLGMSIALGQFYESVSTFPDSEKVEGKYKLKWYGMKASEVHKKLFEKSSPDVWKKWNIKQFIEYLSKEKVNNCPEAAGFPEYDGQKHMVYDKLAEQYNTYYVYAVNEDFVGSYKDTTVCTLAHGSGDNSLIIRKLFHKNTKPDTDFDLSDPAKQYCSGIETDTRIIAIAINNSLKPILNVLEIEPDNKFDLSDDDIRSWLSPNILVRISIEQKTMSEFVGLVDDLNSKYDLIYFGNNMDRMKVNNLYSMGIYGASTELSALQGSSVLGTNFEYSGNDITNRMIKRVEAFMEAGFPVVYESALKDVTKIDSTTNMYKFINAHSSKMYAAVNKSMAGTISDSKIDTKKPDIIESAGYVKEYKESGSVPINKLNFKVALKYGEGDYRVFVYVDTDHNGIFNQWEKVSGVYKLDSNYEQPLNYVNVTAGRASNIAANIPDKARLGVVSWKIEVVKLKGGNLTGIRACKTGNSKVQCVYKKDDGTTEYGPRTVNVLQLSDLSNPETPNLSKNSSDPDIKPGEGQFVKLLKSSTVSDSFKVNVESMDIYDTDYSELPLLDYDVVIVGFVNKDKKLVDSNGLLNKLAIAAGRGKGIIFTQDALSYFNDIADAGHWGTDSNMRIRKMLGMDRYDVSEIANPDASKMAFTYTVLGAFAGTTYFDGFAPLGALPDLDNMPVADYVERINSAKVARFPYIINTRSVGFDSVSGIYQADVEEELVGTKDVQQSVGYFCLSNEKVTTPTAVKEPYSISPKDIRNNYYLWRHDTTFYSGITKKAFSGSGKTEELKLFVNTIISAFGLDRYVEINVKNLPRSSDYADGKAYYLYADIDYDADSFEGEKDIAFTISTKNISASGLKLSFYRADRDGHKLTESGAPKKLHVVKQGDTFKVAEGSGSETLDVEEKKDYTFKYPLTFMNDVSYPNIVMEVVKDLGSSEVKDTVLIRTVRRSMFDLD